MLLYLVRHGPVCVVPERPAASWHLSREGRAAVDALAGEPFWAGLNRLHTSPEPKAVATAQRIAARHGLPISIERDLREVEGRSWVEQGYDELARRYLAGGPAADWEPRQAAQRRVEACIDGIVRAGAAEAGVVSHGLLLTVYLTGLLELDAEASCGLWAGMRFPDLAAVDPEVGRLERSFGRK